MQLLLITQTRNKKNQLARTEQTLSAESLRIGRGSDCQLHLPDSRVALNHAVLTRGDDGAAYLEAAGGSFSVDGSFERRARLKPGQRILIGPYELFMFEAPAPHDLGLTLELIDPQKEGEEEVRKNVRAGLARTALSKRLLSWLGLAAVLAAFLAWPVLNALNPGTQRTDNSKQGLTADASWDVGPLSSAHASFGSDCGKCHQEPFVQVKDQACEDCHKTIGWHFPLDSAKAKAIHAAVFVPPADYRCASCHRDHKGPNGLVRTDASICTDCHKDLKTRHADTASPNITDFSKDHPAFMLSMLVPGKKGAEAIQRVKQDAGLKEASGLKFAHDLHASKKGIRGPDGRETLECKSCHVPDEAGLRFKPVTMKDHCQRCHSLEFEPKVTARQVPHGKIEDVLFTLNEFYAAAALADTPIDVVVDAGIRRPGEKLAEGKRQAALAWAREKSDKIAADLFTDRVCFVCHAVTRVAAEGAKPAGWSIPAVAVTQHFLPKSRFPHNQHNTFECGKCHSVENSKTSADLSIPDLKACQKCHGGNEPAKDKARGTCETCHGFHTGSHRAGVPVIVPGGVAAKSAGKAGIAKPDAGKDSGANETTRDKPPAPRKDATKPEGSQ
ncbi:MAG TPA: cytochrome c3 family protein [Usitatibacteraceae bacterium]|nr:cytochrome c3 family protein [Usitatibacteraceae bacterium]